MSSSTNSISISNSNDNNNNNNNNNIFNEIFKRLSNLTDQEEIELVLKSLMETKAATVSLNSQTTNRSDSQNSRVTKASGDTNQLFASSVLGMALTNSNGNNEVANQESTTSLSALNQFPLLDERPVSDALSKVAQNIGKYFKQCFYSTLILSQDGLQ
jgi:hypothetical protein